MGPRQRWAAGVLAVTALACGHEARLPNAPTPVASPATAGLAAGAVLSVVFGDSGAPLPQASVTIDGRSYVADAQGRITVTAAARPGALVDAGAPGFLDRQTTVRTRPVTTLSLWPRTSPHGIDESFTASIVYTSASLEGGPVGVERLRRLPADTRQVVIVPSAEILDDDVSHDFHRAAVARLTAAARGAVSYTLSRERPAAGLVFDAQLRPSDPLCQQRVRAVTRLSLRADEIVAGEIVYCSWDAARSATVVHEMGHTFGLRHSDDPREVMFGSFVRGRGDDLSPREADIMALMMQRPAGNRFPDSDREVGGLSARDAVIVCR